MMVTKDSQNLYNLRHARLADALQAAGLDSLALNAGFSLYYLTGLNFHLSERPVVMIFTPPNPPALVLPKFEAGKAESLSFPIQVFSYEEEPSTWEDVFKQAARAVELNGKKMGIEPRRMRVLELRLLEAAAPEAQFISAEDQMASLRMHKDEAEILAMRKAVGIAQRALQAALPLIQPGMTERQLAAELTLQLLRHGSDAEMPFSPIVASGPNSANPHAFPSSRRLTHGDLLILDWGASAQGYYSDLTRTFSIGEPESEFRQIADIVAMANKTARTLAAPGVTAAQVDKAAREVIEQAGYGKYFLHRTGHGLGLEGHEEPYIRAGNLMALKPGMTFTIEPGIYISGRGGVRIEDDFLITRTGGESLSDLPRDLMIIGI
jgi:Xaa-Pro dipeptidase